MDTRVHRAFLKWAGGKAKIAHIICAALPKTETLVEPFVGAGSIFLHSDYSHYILNDINSDLINLYKLLQRQPEQFIADASEFFQPSYNQEARYYQLRQQFNDSSDKYHRSLLFLYLNRHCYNGLCRYNSSGGFNVPFGRYKQPMFPEQAIRFFAEKAQRAEFRNQSFTRVFKKLPSNATVYCDPPYAPRSKTAYFTQYAKTEFGVKDQRKLAEVAKETAREQGISVLLSNHDTPLTRELYQDAQLTELQVARVISQNGEQRDSVGELLALFT